MNKETMPVGIDVGKQELVVALDGRTAREFGSGKAEIRQLVRWLISNAKGRPIHVGVEATGVYGRRLVAELVQHEPICVSVINPAQIAHYRRMMLKRTKTDRVDAEVIREFVRTQSPPAWVPPSAVRQQLYALVAQTDAVGREIRQWRNRQHAQQYDPDVSDIIVRSTAKLIAVLEEQQIELQAAIDQLCEKERELADDIRLLTSTTGIARRSAAQILGYGKDSLTNRGRRQLDAHAGLAPAHHQSGTSVKGKSHLAKQGNADLRRVLYMPTLVAVHHNPVLKRTYQRLLDNNKPKKVALVACMRKLLNIIRAMLINRKPFDPNYNTLT